MASDHAIPLLTLIAVGLVDEKDEKSD